VTPVGTKSAASFPNTSATVSSRRRTVGSSPNTSSPPSASAIAFRMAGEGLVTVSERRSIIDQERKQFVFLQRRKIRTLSSPSPPEMFHEFTRMIHELARMKD